MDVIFMGTPDFSIPVLKALTDSKDHTVKAVVSQPDKARGRSSKPVSTPVKAFATERDIDVYTPEKVKDTGFIKTLKNIGCDVIVVVAFGQILPQEILDIPRYGCINVHASLLPRWRGAAPIQWSIITGDAVTGITTMQMDAGLDTGDILLKKKVPIAPDETSLSLFEKLSPIGADLLLETLYGLENGEIKPKKQDEKNSTYAKIIKKELGRIDYTWEAARIERYIRGLSGWPGVYGEFFGKTLKVFRAEVVTADSPYEPGTISEVTKKSFSIQTGRGQLRLLEVGLEGKKRMDAASFLNGMKLEVGKKVQG